MLVVCVVVPVLVCVVDVVGDVVTLVVAVVVVVGLVVGAVVVVAAAVVVATSAQHLIDATPASSSLQTILAGSICDARDGTVKCPPSHSSDAQITCKSKLHPVPWTTS